MYDGRSLSKLLCDAGFAAVSIMPPGKTNITDPGGLDLEERAEESVYVEGVR
jgi:crotonobetainyl-CoA:carnitine CoA-transferase CaiB-like acyl-CoA transferase